MSMISISLSPIIIIQILAFMIHFPENFHVVWAQSPIKVT